MTETDNALYLLDKLAELRDRKARLDEQLAKARADIMRDVQPRLDRLEKQHAEKAGPTLAKLESLEEKIKTAVVSAGETIKSDRLMAVYYKPRVTWDSNQLEALSAAYPAIRVARREQESGSAQIREIK